MKAADEKVIAALSAREEALGALREAEEGYAKLKAVASAEDQRSMREGDIATALHVLTGALQAAVGPTEVPDAVRSALDRAQAVLSELARVSGEAAQDDKTTVQPEPQASTEPEGEGQSAKRGASALGEMEDPQPNKLLMTDGEPERDQAPAFPPPKTAKDECIGIIEKLMSVAELDASPGLAEALCKAKSSAGSARAAPY